MANEGIRTKAWQELRLRILARDAYTCAYCGDTASQVDHIVPRSKGGDNNPDNLTAACRTCNIRKKDKPLAIFSTSSRPSTPPLSSLSPMVRFDPESN